MRRREPTRPLLATTSAAAFFNEIHHKRTLSPTHIANVRSDPHSHGTVRSASDHRASALDVLGLGLSINQAIGSGKLPALLARPSSRRFT